MHVAPWLLVGPRGSRRIAALQQALAARGAPAAEVVAYEDLLDEPARLAAAIARTPAALVKLESPGEAPALHAALVQRGWRLAGAPGPEPRLAAHGELRDQQHWFAGFADLLAALPRHGSYLAAPGALIAMADKLACQQRLIAAGVPVPPLYGALAGYEDLRERLRIHAADRVFVKARYGSSGAGVLAYCRHRDGREVAVGTVRADFAGGGLRLFNSLRPQRHDDSRAIAAIIDALALQGAYAERWIPKPALAGGGHFDVRVVTLDGQPRQRIARASRGPLTNLHLGNRRVAVEDCVDADGRAALATTARAAAAVFRDARMIGFDVIVRGGRSWVLEANGFGDLLPGLRHEGRTTYDDQAALGRHAGAGASEARHG